MNAVRELSNDLSIRSPLRQAVAVERKSSGSQGSAVGPASVHDRFGCVCSVSRIRYRALSASVSWLCVSDETGGFVSVRLFLWLCSSHISLPSQLIVRPVSSPNQVETVNSIQLSDFSSTFVKLETCSLQGGWSTWLADSNSFRFSLTPFFACFLKKRNVLQVLFSHSSSFCHCLVLSAGFWFDYFAATSVTDRAECCHRIADDGHFCPGMGCRVGKRKNVPGRLADRSLPILR